MKRKYLLAVTILMACSIQGMAQTTPPTSEEMARKKEINKIKLSEEAIYADVTEMIGDDAESLSLAHRKSRDMLQAHVIEVFAKRMKMSKQDVQEIWDVIDDKCQNIEVKKGDLFRVFTYIMKDAIGLGRKKASEADVEKYLGTEEERNQALADKIAAQVAASTPVVAVSEPVAVPEPVATPVPAAETKQEEPAQAIEAQPEPVAVTEPVAAPEPVATPSPVTVPEPVVVPEPVSQPAPVVEPKPKEPAPAIAAQPAASVAIPERVKIILDKSSMNEVARYLNAEQQNHNLIYGNMRTMQNPEKCFIVLIEKSSKKVAGVLSQGTNRINYLTGKADHLNNYKGGNYSAIFVLEY